MARYGMSLPMAGVPLHAHRDWLTEMVDLLWGSSQQSFFANDSAHLLSTYCNLKMF